MSIIVETKDKTEEKVLLAFLDSLHYSYKQDVNDSEFVSEAAFLQQYNQEIDEANNEIEMGNYINHQTVEELFRSRKPV